MNTTVAGVRTLTELDFVRLQRLGATEQRGELHDELASMDIVPTTDMPDDVVTMHSRIRIVHIDSIRVQVLTLGYPYEAQPSAGLISILSPAGRALLGLRVGDIARWSTPDGGTCSAQVTALLYQPEANGDLTA